MGYIVYKPHLFFAVSLEACEIAKQVLEAGDVQYLYEEAIASVGFVSLRLRYFCSKLTFAVFNFSR